MAVPYWQTRGQTASHKAAPVKQSQAYDEHEISTREKCASSLSLVTKRPTHATHTHTHPHTLKWAVLTVLWIGFCLTGPISLCADLCVFIYVHFVCFCFTLHSCCVIVSMVGWTWWDWSLILKTYLPSVLWHCWLGHLTRKNPSPIWPIMCLVGR